MRLCFFAFTLWAMGCSRDHVATPEETVAQFVGAMEQSRLDPSARQRAYGMLSERAQARLEERAQRASQVSGADRRPWEPWEMLAPGRWRLRIEFDAEMLSSHVAGDRAVVTARGRRGGTADVPLVREEGVWRMDMDIPAMAPRER